MARPGRPPKIATMSDLPESLVAEIDLAVLSLADESATSIYTRFGLAQRGIGKSSFDKYVGTLRREQKDRRFIESPPPSGDIPSWDEIDRMARREMLARLNAGDTKVYELVMLSKSRREADKLDLERMAEARAEELHRAKIATLTASIKKDVESRTGEGKTLTREEVYDAIDKAMRGEL